MNLLSGFFGGVPPQMNLTRQQSGRRVPVYFDLLKAFEMFGKPEVQYGNKVFMPPSALNVLANQNLPYPMMFCLQNTFLNRQTYVGVLEFIADEGIIQLPSQVFQNLNLEQGQPINVALTPDIPRGKYVKIQPHETAFIDVPDPRSLLEVNLRNFTCLTEGDTIQINFNNKIYKLDILQVKPENNYKTVCIIETDIEIDFAPPLDYNENLPLKKADSKVVYEEDNKKKGNGQEGFVPFQGKAARWDGKAATQPAMKEQEKKEEYDPRKHRLQNGVKTKIFNEDFVGKGEGSKLGQTPYQKKK